MEEEFQKVKSEVEKLTGEKKKQSMINFKDQKIIYGGVFLFVFLILIFLRPSFLFNKGEKEDEKKFSFLRLLVYTIILSVLLIIFYEFLERRKFLKM